MKLIGVIPARYASTRMPGKPLADILGKPMIWWVYQEAKKCKKLDDVFIATDDERIAEACRTYGMEYCMTSPDHDTPTGRIWEVSTKVEADLYLQIMGDEPLINVKAFDLILPDALNPVLTKELIYTGITRAKNWFTLIEPRAGVFEEAVRRKVKRLSGLMLELDDGVEPSHR